MQGAPDIAVTLACPATPSPLGGPAGFSGTVRNAGDVTVTNVVVTQNAPAPNTVVFTYGQPGARSVGQFQGELQHTQQQRLFDRHPVSASANDKCAGAAVIASATIDCPVVAAPRIVVTQACPPNPVAPGELIVYSGSISNAGNITLTNITVLGSQPTPNAVVFTLATLETGATATFSGSFNAPLDACLATSTLTASGQAGAAAPPSRTTSQPPAP